MEKSDAIQRMDLKVAGADGKPSQDFRISGHPQQFSHQGLRCRGNMRKASHHAEMNFKNFTTRRRDRVEE